MANRCQNLLTVHGSEVPEVSALILSEQNLGCELPTIVSSEEGKTTFVFDTADDPAEKWVLEQSKRYPNLGFVLSYHEGGCFQCGQLSIQNGLKRVDKEWNKKCEEAIAFLEDAFGWNNYPV